MWMRDSSGDLIQWSQVVRLTTSGSGIDWSVNAKLTNSSDVQISAGHSSRLEAQTAAFDLIDGVSN